MLKSTKLRNKIDIKSSNIDSKSPRSTVSYCFPGFPEALRGFPRSPGVRSQKVQRASEGSRRSLEGSRRLIFGISVNIRLLLLH